MLHDPAYRQRYEIDLRREFPRVYFQDDFAWWADQGRTLLDLHINFETIEPYPLHRSVPSDAIPLVLSPRQPLVPHPRPDPPSSARPEPPPTARPEPPPTARPEPVEGRTPKTILRADKQSGTIRLDDQTTLSGVPIPAWQYQLGSRSALEWVLDQYKERKPRDPTIRERFNTYRFADHKERVIDLLGRVCAVSVETVRIVDDLGRHSSLTAEG